MLACPIEPLQARGALPARSFSLTTLSRKDYYVEMIRPRLATLCILILAMVSLAASAEEPTPNPQRFKLSNGLALYVYRDTAVPLERIQLAFRAGAIAQGSDNAGLFHLYEHMLFRGVAYKAGADAMKAELARIGASEWNGGTSAERVSYWLALPSSSSTDGLTFLANAVCGQGDFSQGLDEEKQVVVKEIGDLASHPDTVYEAAMTRRLFAKYPWRRDPAGSEKSVAAATAESLSALQSIWFVPNNAALFVGGDVDPETVRADVERLFGSWKAGPDPWAKALPPSPKPGVTRPTWIVFPDPSLPEGIGAFEARYRGPDLGTDSGSSYAADLWSALLAKPAGRFKSALMKNVPKLYGDDSISAAYMAQRDGSWISVSAYFLADPAQSAVDRARAFKERSRGFEMTSMRGDPSYFSAADYIAARKRLLDARALSLDSAANMVDALAYWWASASVDWFLGYPEALEKCGQKELASFIDTYVMRNLEIVAVRMNPADFAKEKKSFDSAGFEVIGPANAFWWKK